MLNRRFVIAASLATVAMPVRAQATKVNVITSFSILRDIVDAIGGERVLARSLVRQGDDAHVYRPAPGDIKLVANCDLIVSNGLKFDSWLTRLVQSSATKAPVVEAARGVTVRTDKSNDTHGHSHGKPDKHGHDHGGLDPHAWQAVGNVKIYAANIRDGLITADPGSKALYEANATRYFSELDTLDADIRATVARIPADKRKVITSHEAFGYFQDAYGIRFIAPRGISTDAEPTARDVARIIEQIRREKITAVFIENLTDPRLMQRIAQESGARIGGTLYSDALSAADGPAPTYIQMMRHNIKTISAALLPAS
jgi:zinc/manganese transport system substrate-binding protein